MPASEAPGKPASEDLTLITDAARAAGEIAMGRFRGKMEVWLKGGTSPVSDVDIAVDRLLRETLLAARPDHGWLSEETVDPAERLLAHRTFVVDPIDGTRAFLDGKRGWCVSIAIVEDGRPVAGVLACPALEETYTATRGGRARMNGRPIGVRKAEGTLTVAGARAMIDALPETLRQRVERHRHVPSLAHRIAMVASGALDATFIKPGSHDWDLAAADLILHEAGGKIVDGKGRAPCYAGANPRHGALAAAGSTEMLRAMTDVIVASRA